MGSRRVVGEKQGVHPDGDVKKRQFVEEGMGCDAPKRSRNVRRVVMGRYEMETEHFSPFPPEYSRQTLLFICEYTLKYMRHYSTLAKHAALCTARSPPGREIYRDRAPLSSALRGMPAPSDIAVYEVDGAAHKLYAQCLCLLSRLFMGSKTLAYDVEPFLFYVLCEYDGEGDKIVGYFSKEKDSEAHNTLSCILVLPPHQGKGYGAHVGPRRSELADALTPMAPRLPAPGQFLMALAYELARRAHVTGSPERPLSDQGREAFRTFWTGAVLAKLVRACTHPALEPAQEQYRAEPCLPGGQAEQGGHGNTEDIARETGIKEEDVLISLRALKIVKSAKRNRQISLPQDQLSRLLKLVKPTRVPWTPSLLSWGPAKEAEPEDPR